MLCPLAAASASGFLVAWVPRTPLGQICGGVLRPLVLVERIHSGGVARLACPRCGAARPWFPSGAATAVAGTRRPGDRPD